MRNVELNFEPDDIEALNRTMKIQEFWAAVGYLSTWALDSYDTARLYLFRDGEIAAHYQNPQGGRYEIHALPSDDGTYHFHS